MAATEFAASSGYTSVGTRQFVWVETMANYKTPTRSELDAGTDITGEVASVEGFTVSTESVDRPNFKSRFTAKVAGKISVDDCTVTAWADEDGADLRTVFSRDDAGFFVIYPEGDDGASATPAHKLDVWPVTIGSVSKPTSDSDPAQIVISMVPTAEPAENVAVPADA